MSEPSASPRQTSRTLGLVLRVLISATLLALILWRVDWQEFYRILLALSPLYLLFPISGYYVNIALSAYKWQLLLSYLNIREKFRSLFTTYFIGVYFSNFLPTSIGGDGYRFLKLRSDYPGTSERIFSSIILERGYGYLTLLAVHFILLLRFWKEIFAIPVLRWTELGIVGAIVLGAVAIWLARNRLDELSGWWGGFRKVARVFQLLEVRDPRTLLGAFTASALFVLIGGIGLWMYYLAAGTPIAWDFALYVSTVVSVVGVVPLTLNGLGLAELVQVVLLGTQGVAIETVIVVSLAQRILGILLSLPGAGFYFGRSLRVPDSLEQTDD